MPLEPRAITVTTPLPLDDLLFARMEGTEEVSRCFEYTVTLASMRMDVDATELLGKPVTIKIASERHDRWFNGFVDEFGLTEFGVERSEYVAVLRPWTWFLTKTTDNRIFQNMSVVEIIEAVFSEHAEAKFEKRLQSVYEPREYCVQYGESDLDFLQRLMEHEGIFYFFEHADGEHRMVLTDAMSELKPVPNYETIAYRIDDDAGREREESVTKWRRTSRTVSGSYTQTDYDFEKPAADLLVRCENPLGHTQDAGKLYSYPGNHIEIGRGEALSAIRTEEIQAAAQRADASATTIGPWAGATFTFKDYPREPENVEYMILGAKYLMEDSQYRAGSGDGSGFAVTYHLMPTSLTYRPKRRTPKPSMKGPQTAIVVGPQGEEIYTDAYSRVKVQFHWDRLGCRDEASTCFIRVSSAWAGGGWGFIQIPRIGEEVIVDFLEGDPDQPIITGRVYNAAQMPPYGLPGSATQSGWKSNSTPGGGGWNELRFEDKKGSEEVYFQAEKDHNELVKNNETRTIGNDWVEDVGHDGTQSIGNNRTESVGNDKSTSVGNNRSVSIGANDDETVGADRSLNVGSNETISIGSNSSETIGLNHTQTVGAAQAITVALARADTVGAAEVRTVGATQTNTIGVNRSTSVGVNQSHDIGSNDSWDIGSNQTVSIGGNQSLTIGGDQSISTSKNRSEKIGEASSTEVGKAAAIKVGEGMVIDVGKDLAITAADSVVIKCGSASISMKKDGTVNIEGKDITVKGSGKINVDASSDITMKGSKINQN